MSKGTTPRAIRIEDQLWSKALTVAKARDETVSAILREALERYVESHTPHDGDT